MRLLGFLLLPLDTFPVYLGCSSSSHPTLCYKTIGLALTRSTLQSCRVRVNGVVQILPKSEPLLLTWKHALKGNSACHSMSKLTVCAWVCAGDLNLLFAALNLHKPQVGIAFEPTGQGFCSLVLTGSWGGRREGLGRGSHFLGPHAQSLAVPGTGSCWGDCDMEARKEQTWKLDFVWLMRCPGKRLGLLVQPSWPGFTWGQKRGL